MNGVDIGAKVAAGLLVVALAGCAPIPEPTAPLGERPRSPGDTTAASGAPMVSPPTHPKPPEAAPVAPDTCWRIQVGASPERAKADQTAKAAESQLLVPMVVEKEKGRFKVRSRECFD